MRAKRPPQLRAADDGPKKEADHVLALQERFGWSEEESTTHSGIVVELRTRYHGGLWSLARVNVGGGAATNVTLDSPARVPISCHRVVALRRASSPASA